MVINLTNQDISQAFIDYARKKLGWDLDGFESVEFRSPRNEDGYCIVVYTKLDHTPIPEIKPISLVERMQGQEKKRTTVIETKKLPPRPMPWDNKYTPKKL